MALRLSWLVSLTLIALACGDDDSSEPDASVDPVDAGEDSGTPPPDMDSSTPPPPSGDGNDSFDTATEAPMEPVMGVIDPAGDLDYYSFEGMAGQWIVIQTTANEDDDPEMIDTVITLFDSSMTQVAENDDRIPRLNTDSELIVQLPSTGTYYLLVQEWSTWEGEEAEGGPSFTYELAIGDINATADLVNVETEAGNTAADAQALTFNAGAEGDFALVLGNKTDATDTADVFSFSIVESRPFFDATILPTGPDGNGATLVPTDLTVSSADGTEIIARIDPSTVTQADGSSAVAPNLPAGDYLLWINHDGAAGANDFYSLQILWGTDNTAENTETDAANNMAATPDAIALEPNGDLMSGFVVARLGADDTDHFSVEVADASHVMDVACRSRTAGSGVVDLSVAILDSTGETEITSATESASEPIAIDGQALSGAGTYLVRLTKGSQDAEVTGDYVRCGVHLGSPSM